MRGIELIRATEEDIDTFVALERSVDTSPTYSATTDPEEARTEIAENIVYFIRENGRIVGSIEYQVQTPKRAYISGLVIHPDFQGHGLGKAAMAMVLEELKTIPALHLVTHPDNTRAVELYESFGFTIGKRLENHYGDGEPRIVMTLKR